ncbi:hypothetical protein MKX01_017012 [Papaver californicum]|nr:hypothetical protein MKX01_017012 [Papaver californicum]
MAEGMPTVLVICAVFIMVISNIDAFGQHHLDWMSSTFFDGSTGDSLKEEFQMDSEISSHILTTTKYISYGSPKKNNVHCSRIGASYYTFRIGAQVNPYQHRCSKMSKCRS